MDRAPVHYQLEVADLCGPAFRHHGLGGGQRGPSIEAGDERFHEPTLLEHTFEIKGHDSGSRYTPTSGWVTTRSEPTIVAPTFSSVAPASPSTRIRVTSPLAGSMS